MTARDARRFLLLLALLAIALAAGMTVWKTRIAGCAGYGHGPGIIMASCSVASFGDYEQGALVLGLEPRADAAARAAEVVLLGYSHGHVAFSADATRRHAAGLGTRIYNLSLSGSFSPQADAVLQRLRIHPHLVVIDADPFFLSDDPRVRSPILQGLLQHPWRQRIDYVAKRLWQGLHRRGCEGRGLAALCGTRFSFFRDVHDGRIIIDYSRVLGSPLPRHPVPESLPADPARVATHAALARGFLARHGFDPACTIITVVPSHSRNGAFGKALAAAISAPFVGPEMPGLTTVDGAHLDEESRERWSDAFWTEATPLVRRCLGRPQAALPRRPKSSAPPPA